ncbi:MULTISPECIES: chemotaxis protein [unclassified Lebetimonas]|uniref:chemotaxis protein n=1 Tax=unclassified Lebetimonas TaxID=2648158 RepID=UPI0004670E73|nr:MULTISPECIES: chemotaxis protein [unclassified Lebetimonas]
MADDKILKAGSNELELVDFRLFKKDADGKIYEGIYGINVAKVREIIKMPELTELPGSEDFVEGIFDLRGVVVPVVNLAKWMGIKEPNENEAPIKKRVIIAEFNNMLIGFIVHDAKRIRRISWADIEPASFGVGQGKLDKSKITGITKLENGEIMLILDLESIVEEMGLFEANLEFETDKIEKFSGLVLLVDDSLTARKMEKEALEKMGFDVIEAKNGEEGLQKLEELYSVYGDNLKEKLKLILSDVEMPKMDGYHMAAKIHNDSRFKNIPLIFSSSISDAFSDERGKAVGAEGYLVKFDPSKFYKSIADVLKNSNKE